MKLVKLVLVPACLLLAAAGGAVSGRVSIKKSDGTERADRSGVVVFVADVSAPDPKARASIRQSGKQFVPKVSAVPAGATVTFPNDDPVEHNVFSHSAIADFDLGRFGGGRQKPVLFREPGVAEIFCNVHKEMVSYLVVTPSPAFAVTGSDGAFSIADVPAGPHSIKVWERFARPRMKVLEVDVKAGEVTPLDVTVEEQLDMDPAHLNKFGVEYSAGYH